MIFSSSLVTAFTAGLLLVGIAELGDKTFFIAALMAMKHSRRLVFLGAFSALAMMTLLAVTVGQLVGALPTLWVKIAEVGLFAGFGLKLLYDGLTHQDDGEDEAEEAEEAIAKAEGHSVGNLSALGVISKTFGLVFLGEWGDRTQITTVILAASHPALGVTLGALSGFGVCIALAVLAGRLVAGRISERATNFFAGTLFLMFAIAALVRS